MVRKLSVTIAAVFLGGLVGGNAFAKKTAAEQASNAKTQFAKLVANWQAALKEGPLTGGKCSGLAKDFAGFGDDNHSAEGYFNAGVLYETCGNFKDAQSMYRQALGVNPRFAAAMVNIGEIAYRNGDTSTAQQQFDSALAADPKNAQAYTDTAQMLFDRVRTSGDKAAFDEIIGKLRRALAVDANDSQAYTLLALVYYTQGLADPSKLELAELVIDRGKQIDEKYAPLYNVLGLIKLRKKSVTGALTQFKKAVSYDPHFVEAQLNIGAITLSARDYKSAEGAFQAVLDAKPTDKQQLFDATIGMGVALRGQRRIDEAEKWYNSAKALNSRDCSVAYNLGILYQDYKGNPDTDLRKAQDYFNDFKTCSRDSERVKDAQRRVKDIDDTFKALAEQKKIEEENKKLQEEAEKIQKQQEQQQQQRQNANPGDAPPPSGGAATEDQPKNPAASKGSAK